PTIISGPIIKINKKIVPIICSTATLIFFGAIILATQCGEDGVPNEFEINIENNVPKPNAPTGDKRIPSSSAGPPSIVGAVVVANVCRIFPMPSVNIQTTIAANITPMVIRMVFSVSVAATDQNPPILVKIINNKKPNIANSYLIPVIVENTMPNPVTWIFTNN